MFSPKPLLLLLGCAACAQAHHSAAVFDGSKTLMLAGTVKEFQWTNPHCWVQLLVHTNGGEQEWGLEMSAPGILSRHGWHPSSLKPGDAVTVRLHPLRDGSAGGNLVTLTTANGSPIGTMYQEVKP
jgi:hypothetical protein